MKFVAIDFETANSKRSSACSVGLVVVEDGIITKEIYKLIRPVPDYFDSMNISIHGIRPEDVIDAEDFVTVWSEIAPYIEKSLVIAHNAAFDMSLLRAALDAYQKPYGNFQYACTMKMAEKTYKGLISKRLSYLCYELGIELNHHHALSDAKACAELYIKISEKQQAKDFDSLMSKIGMIPGTITEHKYTPCSTAVAKKRKYYKKEITAQTTDFDTEHIFYDKTVVFTGTLSISRDTAKQLVVDKGAVLGKGVTGNTDYLIVGGQGYRFRPEDFESSKMKKAKGIIEKGGSLEVITESDFLEMVL